MAVSLALAAVCLIHMMGLFLTIFFGIPIKAYPDTYASGISTFSGSRVFPAFSSTVRCWRWQAFLIHCMSICTFLSSGSYSWALLLFVVAANFTRLGEVVWLPKVITTGMKIPSLQMCSLSLRVHFWHSCQAKHRLHHISAFQTWCPWLLTLWLLRTVSVVWIRGRLREEWE